MNDPVQYRAKVEYDTEKSRRYADRPAWRHEPEMRLLEPALRRFTPGAAVLDAPCGAGRVSVRLAELGLRVTSVDISEPMRELTRQRMAAFGPSHQVRAGDLERLDFADRSFEGAVCFRFFHHLPTAALRRQVVGELCRVSERLVVISFYHPVSFHNLKRRLQTWFLGKPPRRFAIYPRDLAALFAEHGFRQVHLAAQQKYLKTLWLAAFERG